MVALSSTCWLMSGLVHETNRGPHLRGESTFWMSSLKKRDTYLRLSSCLDNPDNRPPPTAIQKQLSELPHVTDSTRYRIMHGEMERLMERVVPKKAEVSWLYMSSDIAILQFFYFLYLSPVVLAYASNASKTKWVENPCVSLVFVTCSWSV